MSSGSDDSDDELDEVNPSGTVSLGSTDDYYPFNSCIHALAFMVTRGPRPVVSIQAIAI